MMTQIQVSVCFATFGLMQVLQCLSLASIKKQTLLAHNGLMRKEVVHWGQGGGGNSRRRGTTDVEFGGEDHGGTNAELERPEAVKSERCDEKVCHVCQHKSDDGCWHGTSAGDKGNRGDMTVAVQANSHFSSFTQEVFLSCSSSAGSYELKVNSIDNGKIAVYVNSKLVQETTTVGQIAFTFDTGTKARVRAVFTPIEKGSPSGAIAKIQGKGIDESVDACMTTKLCMPKLGDGSNAAFELRNSNDLQYKCLASGAGSLSSHLQSECTAWVICLPDETEEVLKVLLKISGASLTSSSLADKVSTQGNLTSSVDPNSCIDPAVDDPESWDCECAKDMTTSCGGVDEACFKRILCGKAEICQTWKDDAECSTFLIQKSEDEISGTHSSEALGQRSQEMASSGIVASLDGSVQGKCSQ